MTTEPFHHVTVLLEESVDMLQPKPGGWFIDCTLGGGGHTRQLLRRTAPNGRVLALDQDISALNHARAWCSEADRARLLLVHTNFRRIQAVANEHGFDAVDGVLFDLGVSSPQFDDPERGFSYRYDADLDMRMDPDGEGTSAAEWVNQAGVDELTRIFREYGEERFARRIAKAIERARQVRPITRTGELAELVKEAIPVAARRSGPHPARRVFQALRIAVNDELGALQTALEQSFDLLKPGGRVAVISFHSLEDRIVKHTFASWAQGCVCPPDFPVCRCGRFPRARVVTRKPIVPGQDEVARNPRSRSAKLRVAEKLTAPDHHGLHRV